MDRLYYNLSFATYLFKSNILKKLHQKYIIFVVNFKNVAKNEFFFSQYKKVKYKLSLRSCLLVSDENVLKYSTLGIFTGTVAHKSEIVPLNFLNIMLFILIVLNSNLHQNHESFLLLNKTITLV